MEVKSNRSDSYKFTVALDNAEDMKAVAALRAEIKAANATRRAIDEENRFLRVKLAGRGNNRALRQYQYLVEKYGAGSMPRWATYNYARIQGCRGLAISAASHADVYVYEEYRCNG